MNDIDAKILNLVARHSAIETELTDVHDEDPEFGRLVDLRIGIERELEALVPTTAVAAIEQLELLSEHGDAGILALGVLRGLHQTAI